MDEHAMRYAMVLRIACRHLMHVNGIRNAVAKPGVAAGASYLTTPPHTSRLFVPLDILLRLLKPAQCMTPAVLHHVLDLTPDARSPWNVRDPTAKTPSSYFPPPTLSYSSFTRAKTCS